ncbi:hypothetical protein BDV10DRAFT_187764 [Aspergillus recurvatus]
MHFAQLLVIAAPTLLVGATAARVPIPAEALEAFGHLNVPEAFEVFKAVVNGDIPSLAAREAEFEERECCEFGVCCNLDTCQEDGSSCIQNCSTYSSPWQQLGCYAGCAAVCG